MGKLFKAVINLSADFKAELGETKEKFQTDLERGELCLSGSYELEGICSDVAIYADKVVDGKMSIKPEDKQFHVSLSGRVEIEFDPEYDQDFIDFLQTGSLEVCSEHLYDGDLNYYPIVGETPLMIGTLSAEN